MIFWGAVALEAPTHALGFSMVDDLHVVDLAVAGYAANATIHMDGVIEVNVIGGFVNTNPRDWISTFP